MPELTRYARARQSKQIAQPMCLLQALLPVLLPALLLAGRFDPAIASSERIFTISNFPVEASADSAVAAKKQALAEGQQAAFRSLLKRLVPVTSYPLLKNLRQTAAAAYIDGVSVRSEQNSSTDYIATLDFSFQPLAIRQLLTKERVPFLEEIAPQITLVTAYLAPSKGGSVAEAFGAQQGPANWHDAWRGLDLQNTLTPIKLERIKSVIHPDTLKALAEGDTSAMRIFSGEYRTELLVVAVAEPLAAAGKLQVTMSGRDGIGPFHLKRTYGGRSFDPRFTTELAAVISQAIIEGRWKAIRTRMPLATGPAVSSFSPGGPMPISITIEFPSQMDRDQVRTYWWKARRMLNSLDGVQDFVVEGLSTDRASVRLSFPGGGQNLADELLRRGFALRQAGSDWRLLPNDRL